MNWSAFALVSIAIGCKPDTGDSSLTDTTHSSPDTETEETDESGDTDETGGDTPDDTEETADTGPVKEVNLIEHGVVTCADPSARQSEGAFYEPDFGLTWTSQAVADRWPPEGGPQSGMGITIADFTGDGLIDVFLPMVGPSRLFVGQEDGTMVDETEARFKPAGGDQMSEAAVAGDLDSDGDLDLILFNRNAANTLFENTDGVLTEVPGALPEAIRASVGGALGDLDEDGDLDVVVANHDPQEEPPEPLDGGDDNELYINEGGLSFTSGEARYPKSTIGSYTFVAGIIDLDVDGLPDVYLANDRGQEVIPNRYLRNVDGTSFEDVSDETYTNMAMGAMGIGLGDVNDDGKPDMAITNWGPIKLLESLSDGTWLQTEASRGVANTGEHGANATWGLEFTDIDNDGDLDLPIVAGQLMKEQPVPNNPDAQPNVLFVQDDKGLFTNEAAAYGFDDASNHRGLIATDLNQDGWIDLVASDLNDTARFWYSRCGAESWLRVDLSQVGVNPDGIGARVEVQVGDKTMSRWMVAGGTSFVTSAPPEVHFGLGEHEVVDKLEVRWPDGSRSIVEDIEARQRVTVVRSK